MLILIGLRGSGKTTVGKLVAQGARVPGSFIDLDDLVAETGPSLTGSPASVGEILRTHGEARFRSLELAALERACTLRPRVLSLGGGTPTTPQARELLQAQRGHTSDPATIVYLRATPATLAGRLAATDLSSRPSLTGKGVLEEIDTLFRQRDAVYAALADRVIDVDALTPEQTAALLGL